MGLAVYVPSQDPLFVGFQAPDPGPGGPTDNATNYFAPLGNLTIGPGFVFEGDVYLIAGDATIARNIVYELHQTVRAPDIFAPYEATDQPPAGSPISGLATVSGWAFDDRQVAKVEILVDGVVDGIASYGLPRPDVHQVYPASPGECGLHLFAQHARVRQRSAHPKCARNGHERQHRAASQRSDYHLQLTRGKRQH